MGKHDFEIGFLDSSTISEDGNKTARTGVDGHLLDVYSQTIVDVVKEVVPPLFMCMFGTAVMDLSDPGASLREMDWV